MHELARGWHDFWKWFIHWWHHHHRHKRHRLRRVTITSVQKGGECR